MKKNISVKRFLAPDGDHHTTTTFIRRTLRWMMALLALLFAIAIGALVSIANNLNDQADAQSALLLKKALDNRLERLVTHTNDNAWWSEAYENLHVEVNTDWAYSRENLGASQYSDFGYEGLFVIDGQGHTRYSVIRGKLSSLSLTQWLGSDPLPLIHAGLKPDESESSTSARFLLNGNLALLAASTLSAGNGGHVSPVTGPPSLLVFVDVLGPQKLAALGNEYGIQQVRVAQGDTAHGPRLGTLRVPLPSGEVTLAWRSAEPGRQLLRYILPLLLALGVITGLSAVFMMRSALNKARLYDENNFLLEQHRQALTASERRFRDVAEATTDWIWETDAQLNFTYLSERFPSITGHRIAAWLGQPVTEFMQADNVSLGDWITEPGQTGHRRLLHCRYLSAQGHPRYCHIALKPVITESGATGYRGTATDVTLEVEAQARVQYLSLHDELTGLPNRTRMREFLEGKLQALPDNEHPLAMVSLDLDKFKPVNDLFGHPAGDAVLHEVSARLRSCLREYDLVARQGGDEFILILPDIMRREEIEAICARILTEVRKPFIVSGNEIFIGVSMGIALAPQDAVDAGELLRFSDIALYEAKNAGRNTWRFYAPEMEQQIVQRRELEESLRDAIRLQQFRLVYQPRYDLHSRRVTAVEALIRWDHPQLGVIMPDQFIPLAEETGLISAISEWVLRTACRDAAQALGDLAISVNISAVEFGSRGLIERVKAALAAAGLSPERLEIEVTEGVTLHNPQQSLALMQELKALGVRLLIDDFGIGYSSLSYLRSFPFDGIKLDKSFIDAMPHDENANAVVENIIGLGKAFSLSITAEGVETQAQLDKLKMLDCDEMQGYLVDRPLELAALRERLAAMRSGESGEEGR